MDDYGALIRRAWRQWQDAHDPETLSWAEVQRQCAKLLRVPETSVAVLKWKDGEQEPTIAEFRALAQVLGVDPCLLAFGAVPAGLPIQVSTGAPLEASEPLEGATTQRRRKGAQG